MTDAKSRLGPLDRLETPDLWRRATTLDPRSEMDEVASGRRSSKRSIAGIVAFAVFIAAGAFAWQALRPVTRPETALGPIEGTILWPERTAAMLASAQSLADSDDPSVAWRLDPNEVATRFAEDVLGWGSRGSGYTVSTTREGAAAATAVVSRLPVHCPVLAPGTTASCPPPFAEETLTLRQAGTLGETGVWSVTSARASGLDLNLAPGDVVPNGSNIDARVSLPATSAAIHGFEAVGGTDVGTGVMCEVETSGARLPSNVSTVVSVYQRPDAKTGTECGPSPVSYAWIGTVVRPRCHGAVGFCGIPSYTQPLPGEPHTSTLRFYGLTIAPMLVAIPQNAPTSPSETASPGSD